MRFDDSDWYELKLNQYSAFLQGLTYKPSNVSPKGKLVLRSSNIQNNRLAFDDNVYVDMDIPDKISTKQYDVLMCVRNGSQRLVGKTAIIPKEYEGLAWGAFMNIIRPFEPNSYLYHYLNSEHFRQQIQADFNTATVNQITIGTLNDCYISVPIQFESRKKLAMFFDLLSQRIETQSKIIEELLCLKNSICHTLFSNNAFFEGYAPISEYAVLKNGYAFKSTTYTENGSYKVITIANVTGERYYSTEKCNTINELPSDIQQHQVLKIGDILISLTGNVGRVSYCSKPNTLLNQRVGLLTVLKEEYKEYIYQVISACDFEKTMQSCGQGAAQMNIGKSDVESYLIPVPKTLKVAKQISDLLHSYDEKIQTEKDMLTTYKKQKAYLLSQMFI